MNLKSGKIWPYILGGSITMVFGFCVATIVVTGKADIQESNAYMTHYQDADAKANDFIEARIAFNKNVNIEYLPKQLNQDGTDLEYKITDKNGNAVNNAKLKILISRPETHALDQKLNAPSVVDGKYTFKNVKFAKPGVYNFIAKVEVGDLSRFYNIKADTRYKNAFEF
jgi:hypothetical protein